MTKNSFTIYLDSEYRNLVDSTIAEAKRITPDRPHFTPQWSDKGRFMGEISFEASSVDITTLLADIYIFGESSIYEKSVMYTLAKQVILALEGLANK